MCIKWPLSREGSLSCHTCCDTGPRFLWFHICFLYACLKKKEKNWCSTISGTRDSDISLTFDQFDQFICQSISNRDSTNTQIHVVPLLRMLAKIELDDCRLSFKLIHICPQCCRLQVGFWIIDRILGDYIENRCLVSRNVCHPKDHSLFDGHEPLSIISS